MAFKLAVLQETARFDLAEYEGSDLVTEKNDAGEDVVRWVKNGTHPLAGLVAVCAPMGVEEIAKWADAFGGKDTPAEAMVACVRQQLKGIDGLVMVEGTTEGPYDPANPRHFRSLDMEIVRAIYARLLQRATLSEQQAKN